MTPQQRLEACEESWHDVDWSTKPVGVLGMVAFELSGKVWVTFFSVPDFVGPMRWNGFVGLTTWFVPTHRMRDHRVFSIHRVRGDNGVW